MSLASGLLAALFSYYINSKALKVLGDTAITYGAPVLEEMLKTGFALVLGGNVLLAHITFGAVEGVYDIWENRGTTAHLAGLVGFISHIAFGLITEYSKRYFNSYLLGLLLAISSHIAWNYTVMNYRKLS